MPGWECCSVCKNSSTIQSTTRRFAKRTSSLAWNQEIFEKMETPAWGICSLYLFLSMLSAGVVQAAWMSSKLARRTAIPLDRGKTFRGQRIFGDNKTWRGFVVMMPACGLTFVLWRLIFHSVQAEEVLWPVSLPDYFFVGTAAGLGFMLAELPNSFFKRQAGVQPGQAAESKRGRVTCFLIDQVDSVIGSLLAVNLCVPVPSGTWLILVFGGAVVHLLFNFVLRKLGLRSRAA